MSNGSEQSQFSRICGYCRQGTSWHMGFRIADYWIKPTGLSAREVFSECTYCRLPFCDSCKIEHEPGHERALTQISIAENGSPVSVSVEDCARCSKPVLYRYSCHECLYSLCRGCWSDKSVNMHVHTRFHLVEPEARIRLANGGTWSESCCTKASFLHCSTCSSRKCTKWISLLSISQFHRSFPAQTGGLHVQDLLPTIQWTDFPMPWLSYLFGYITSLGPRVLAMVTGCDKAWNDAWHTL